MIFPNIIKELVSSLEELREKCVQHGYGVTYTDPTLENLFKTLDEIKSLPESNLHDLTDLNDYWEFVKDLDYRRTLIK